MRPWLLGIGIALTIPGIAFSQMAPHRNGPDCSGLWPTDMAFATLKNAGIVKSDDFDSSKTKTARIASEKIGKGLWRQVYSVKFTKLSGEVIEAVVVHDASKEECSMSAVDVYVVTQHLNSDAR